MQNDNADNKQVLSSWEMGTSILEANCTSEMTYVLSDLVHTSYISKTKQKNEEWKEAKGSETHVRVAKRLSWGCSGRLRVAGNGGR